ncbi:hypothetical protein O3M35_013189 [Rhynocoris fuscipes]|uniref:Uncharacterized protein n=1 Tax=Rhynocoris fuscipes TaxID=488301 RepID=A0AAW1CE56_9HEMI
MGLLEDFRCRCGERETAQYIIMACAPLYEDSIAALQRKIGVHLGLDGRSLPLLIENKVAYEEYLIYKKKQKTYENGVTVSSKVAVLIIGLS